MKRKLEIDLTVDIPSVTYPSNGNPLPHDAVLLITAAIDAPSCIDVKTFLYWHATCRYLWEEYTRLSPSEVLHISATKYEYLKVKHANSLFYYFQHRANLWQQFYTLQRLNERMKKMLMEMKSLGLFLSPAGNDPMRSIGTLCNLEKLHDVIDFRRGDNGYARELLLYSCKWVKIRYGWDIRVAQQAKDGSRTLLPLKWPGDKTQQTLIIVACNASYFGNG
jgi:hypothetical protein